MNLVRSARLIIVDEADRLLLFRYHDEHRPPFWSTAGGQLQGDEDYRAAAARELREETGFDAQIDRFLRVRDEVYAVANREPERWIEHYFLVLCDAVGPLDQTGWTDEERTTIRHWRWWTLEELRSTDETILPAWIPELLAEVLAG